MRYSQHIISEKQFCNNNLLRLHMFYRFFIFTKKKYIHNCTCYSLYNLSLSLLQIYTHWCVSLSLSSSSKSTLISFFPLHIYTHKCLSFKSTLADVSHSPLNPHSQISLSLLKCRKWTLKCWWWLHVIPMLVNLSFTNGTEQIVASHTLMHSLPCFTVLLDIFLVKHYIWKYWSV